MEDAFGRFGRAFGLRSALPPVNAFQDEDGVTVIADVPGVKPEDLSVEAEGDSLRIAITRATPEGVDDDKFHRRERPTGEFKRELKLPAGLDTEKIEATLNDGVLTVRLPKAEAAKPRKIAIKAE
jgi:HSP20 family protein